MHIESGLHIPSTLTDVVIKIGMSTYSSLSKTESILYDQNLELSTIYISQIVSKSLSLTVPNSISFIQSPLSINSNYYIHFEYFNYRFKYKRDTTQYTIVNH